MTFQTCPLVTGTPDPSLHAAPTSRVRTRLPAAVALDADVSIGMAGLAGLQVPSGLSGMLTDCKRIPLAVGAEHLVRLYIQ